MIVSSFMTACFDRDLPELGQLATVEFHTVYFRPYGHRKRRHGPMRESVEATAYHWPTRGYTVSARWNEQEQRWIKGKGWP